MLGMGEALPADEDHLVPEERVADFGECLVGQIGYGDSPNLGAHGGSQRLHLDESGR